MTAFHNFKTIYSLILSDYMRYVSLRNPGKHKTISRGGILLIIMLLKVLFNYNHCFTYSFYMRLASRPNPFRLFAKVKWRRMSRKYGIQIPPSTNIGEGFYIGHGVGIVVNHGTVIGKNCSISHFVSIGSNKRTPATIGDNVYIGPHVCIVENVQIGDNVKIGAGTVVINDIPDNCTSVGNPNRIIRKNP